MNSTTATYCGTLAACVNTVGSWRCDCNLGYGYHTPNQGCVEVNECTDGNFPNNCGSNTICANTVGSFTCTCIQGYTAWAANSGCRDRNECCVGQHSECTHTCTRTSVSSGVCKNTAGTYQCTSCTVSGQAKVGKYTEKRVTSIWELY